MPDEIDGRISPLSKSSRVESSTGSGSGASPEKLGRRIAGEIISVHRGNPHHGENHRLDITVGGEEYTELVLRVPRGEYVGLEGKQAVLHIDE